MRTRLWNNMVNIKFKSFYTYECSILAGTIGNIYSFFLVFASTSSVATWFFWKQYPYLWALIVGISQVLLIAKPYLPFMKNEKEFLAMSFEFEYLYIEYEKLWFCFEDKKKDNEIIEQTFYKLRDKEIEIEKAYRNVHSPKIKYILNKANKEVVNHSKINFPIGG